MPIYEYRCAACKRKVTVLTLRASEAVEPQCDHCGSRDLSRLMSRFALVRSEESRLDGMADDSSLNGLDENDPKSMARWMRKMGKELGRTPATTDQMVDELEAGGDADATDGGATGTTSRLASPSKPVAVQPPRVTPRPPWADVLASIEDGVLVLDRTGTLVELNPAAEQLTGVPASQAIGADIAALFRSSPWIGELARGTLAEGAARRRGEGRLSSRRGEVPVSAACARSSPRCRRARDGRGARPARPDAPADLEATTRRADRLAGLGTVASGLAHEIRNPSAASRARRSSSAARSPIRSSSTAPTSSSARWSGSTASSNSCASSRRRRASSARRSTSTGC
jgi:putative FmdB family regulatory protein